jgi:hypothetical protein
MKKCRERKEPIKGLTPHFSILDEVVGPRVDQIEINFDGIDRPGLAALLKHVIDPPLPPGPVYTHTVVPYSVCEACGDPINAGRLCDDCRWGAS